MRPLAFVLQAAASLSLRVKKASKSSRAMTYLRPSLMARSSLLHTASRIAQIVQAAYADACGIESIRGAMPAVVS
jgi:hypothetical protein